MKKRLLFFVGIVLFLSSALFANDNFDSILKEGKVWRYQYKLVVNPDYDDVYQREMCLSGDTLIEGIHFNRMMERQVPDEDETSVAEWTPQNVWIGEENGKVYTYNGLTNTCQLLFDFSLEKGELIEKFGWQWRVIAVTDTILDSGNDRKVRHCLHVVNVEIPYQTDVWVEGIGSLLTGLINTADLEGAIPTLVLCSDEVVLYNNATSLLKIHSPNPELHLGKLPYYDLQGRLMKVPLQGGLYIKDGKKKLLMNK